MCYATWRCPPAFRGKHRGDTLLAVRNRFDAFYALGRASFFTLVLTGCLFEVTCAGYQYQSLEYGNCSVQDGAASKKPDGNHIALSLAISRLFCCYFPGLPIAVSRETLYPLRARQVRFIAGCYSSSGDHRTDAFRSGCTPPLSVDSASGSHFPGQPLICESLALLVNTVSQSVAIARCASASVMVLVVHT
jgi:hypothetical protein